MLDQVLPLIEAFGRRVDEPKEHITTVADIAQEALDNLRQNYGSDWSDWSLLDDSDFQEMKERVKQLERGSPMGPLSDLQDWVSQLQEGSPSGPSSSELNPTRQMLEELYQRVGDLEEQGERGR